MLRIDAEQRRARLARRHLLLPEDRVETVPEVADAVVALHSSDPVSVHLSAAARMRAPSVAAVEQALYDERSVVRHHAMRRTLWVATPDVVRRMHAAATRKLAGPEHRRTVKMLTEGTTEVSDPEGWLATARTHVTTALAEHGPMTARDLGVRVPELMLKLQLARGTKWEATVSAHTRVLLCLGFEGAVLRARPTGTWINGAYTYAAAGDWLEGGLGDLAEREAARDLAAHWLRRFGPATSTDLKWWTGWTAATTRTALTDCGAVEVELDDGTGWVAPGDEDPVEPPGPWVALLPGLDPTTMGWKQRAWYLPDDAVASFDRMGNAGPTIWADGRVVGVWDQSSDGGLRTHLFGPLDAEHRDLLARRLEELAAVVADTRFTVRFPSPASTALRAGGTG